MAHFLFLRGSVYNFNPVREQNNNLGRENEDLRRRLVEVDTLKMSISEYENKIAILNA